MEIKDYNNYNIADITDEDLKDICRLEKTISAKNNEDIVLIAYKHTQDDIVDS